MKPAAFDYVRATSSAEALEALHQAGADARVLAGGQSLLPMLNMRLARPRVLVDIMHVAEWQGVGDDGQTLRIGAAVRQAALQRHADLGSRQPLLAAVLPFVGHAQTRSRGTICGSVAHADPSAELPLVLVALRGSVHLRSRRHHRSVPAEAFFTGMMATDRADDEIIEAVSLPIAGPGTGIAFREIARRHGDFAIVACAAVADASGVRLVVGGVADRPRAIDLPADTAVFADALDRFAWDLDARDDLHATARYRRELVRQIGRQVMQQAMQCRDAGCPDGADSDGTGSDGADSDGADSDGADSDGADSDGRAEKRSAFRHRNGGMRSAFPPYAADRRHTIHFTLNGRATSADAEPRTLLVDLLRQSLAATGTHVGCEHGVCGACTVQIDGEPARSCIMLAVQAEGADIRTVESLAPAPDRLSVLQECFREHHALQCGFCTPGILMSLDALLRSRPDATEHEIRVMLGGHLCRCTGYVPIMRAALAAQQRLHAKGDGV